MDAFQLTCTWVLDAASALTHAPLLEKSTGGRGGGGSTLTAEGQALLAAWRELQARHAAFLHEQAAWLATQPALDALLKRMSMKTTARNQFLGRISAVNAGPATTSVRVALDGGQQVTVSLTTEAAKELKVKKGQEALALVKSSEVVLVTDFGGYRLSARNQLAGTVANIFDQTLAFKLPMAFAARNAIVSAEMAELGFTEPYLFDRNIAVGFDIFRRDYDSFNFTGNERETTYRQISTGGQLRAGVPLTENLSLALRYGLVYDEVSLSEALFFTDIDGPTGPLPPVCDPLKAGRYLCDVIGNRLTSSVGYSLLYSTLNNAIRPSSGHRILFSQDFAGVGGDTQYLRSRASAATVAVPPCLWILKSGVHCALVRPCAASRWSATWMMDCVTRRISHPTLSSAP